MFPVTLEFKDGHVATVHPPCYGFLKHGNWFTDSDDDDDDDDWDDETVTYDCWDDSWSAFALFSQMPRSDISREGYGRHEEHLGEKYNMSQIKTIWNSGTHLPFEARNDESGEVIALQMALGNSNVLYKADEFVLAKDNVARWAEKHGSNITVRDVMEKFQEYLDKDSDSCLVWHEKGFMGVSADAPADRCLFYLMVNRMLHVDYEYDSVCMMMDEMRNGCTPVQALMISRLIGKTKHMITGKERVVWNGNDYDSCILPMSLMLVGSGKDFQEPVQVPWRQDPYTRSNGHYRDEDYPTVYLSKDNVGLQVNNSMFLPILLPSMVNASGREALTVNNLPVWLSFAKAICKDASSYGRMVSYGSHPDVSNPSSHRFMSTLIHSNPDDPKSGYNVLPRSEWVGIVKDLLLL